MFKKREFKRVYVDEAKKDQSVGYGKFANRSLVWVVKNEPEYFKKIKDLYYDKYNSFKKKKYDHLLKKHFKNEEKHRNKKQEIIDFCIVDKKKGENETVTKEKLKQIYKDISETLFSECWLEAKDTIKKEFEIERDFLVDIHVLRYEELFLKACEPDLSKVPPQFHNSVLAESYYNAIEILAQKEKDLILRFKLIILFNRENKQL